PEPVTLIGMSAAISSLFFAAVGISIWNDRRRDKLAGDEDLADDEASRIDDEVEPSDAPERAEKERRRAGSGGARRRSRPAPRAGRQVAPLLRLAGVSVVDLSGPSASVARARAVEVRDTLTALVVVGGDGTVSLGAEIVAGTPVRLGIVPAGCGNDFARSL